MYLQKCFMSRLQPNNLRHRDTRENIQQQQCLSQSRCKRLYNKGDQSVKSIPLPKLRPSYLLIKVEYVALNPTDWKHTYFGCGATPFSILGCDYAGTVVSIGAEVTKPFTVGDKV